MQGTPPKRIRWIKRLAVRRSFTCTSLRKKAGGLELFFEFRIFDPGHGKQRRRDRGCLYRSRNPTRPNPAFLLRFHDQRNMHGRVVDKESVLALTVLAKRFSVVADHKNHR